MTKKQYKAIAAKITDAANFEEEFYTEAWIQGFTERQAREALERYA